MLAAVIAALWLNKRVPGLDLGRTVARLLLLCIATFTASAAAWFMPYIKVGAIALALTVALKWLVGLAVFAIAAMLLRISEVADTLKLVLSRFPGRAR